MTRALSLLLLLTSVACSETTRSPSERYVKVELHPTQSPSDPSSKATGSGGIEWVEIGRVGNIADMVKDELARAQADKKDLLVYVGATWCEPCKHFYDASKKGELGTELANVRLLKFDFDRHGTSLAKAGYDAPYIPLFVRPEDDGRGGSQRSMGSVKGPQAIDYLKGKVLELLGR
jgi:thiol-disulfide isomerase/thioredoxin